MKKSNFSSLSGILTLLAVLFVSCTCNNRGREIAGWEKQASQVTITRDNYGIPHICGKSDALAVFGLMYAQCEDDFNRVETNYINSQGRMAEVEGESMLYTDLRMRLFIDPEEIIKEYRRSPRWLKKLMNAYADGINYYLYKHPEVKPRLLTRFEPWMALTFSEGSIGGDIEKISVNGLKMFYESKTPGMDDHEENELLTDTGGSNGFAIAPAISESGNALLLINPHTSLFFRPEVHIKSDQGLNAYGAVTWGQFFIYQGFNENCGWMHTSSSADVIDYYLESVIEQEGKYFYKYGDKLRPFEEKIISLKYRDGDKVKGKEFKVWFSHRGPVIREDNGKWVTIRLMVGHEKALTQSYKRTKAKDFDEFYRVMELRTNSSNNTVYADKDGNIAYFHGNFMPVRNEKFDWSKPVDGSDPATEWKGLHNLSEMILIKNPENGWIQNCNSTPFTACGDKSPKKEDYPSYMAPDSENARGINAVRVLGRTGTFTPEKLLDAAYDTYLTAFEELIPQLVSAWDTISLIDNEVKKRLAEPVNELRTWDFRYSLSSVPTSVAVYYGQELMDAGSRVRTTAGGDAEKLSENMIRINALSDALKKLETDFGTWRTPWGEINRYQRITGEIVQKFSDELPSLPVPFVSSRWGSLASFTARTYPGTKRMYGTNGNSFVAVVEFGEKVKAKSILAGGISGDPESPHFDDQARMYTERKFRDVLFYKEDIERNTEKKYHPGEK